MIIPAEQDFSRKRIISVWCAYRVLYILFNSGHTYIPNECVESKAVREFIRWIHIYTRSHELSNFMWMTKHCKIYIMPSNAFSIDRPNNLANDNKLDVGDTRALSMYISFYFISSFLIENVNTIQFSNERFKISNQFQIQTPKLKVWIVFESWGFFSISSNKCLKVIDIHGVMLNGSENWNVKWSDSFIDSNTIQDTHFCHQYQYHSPIWTTLPVKDFIPYKMFDIFNLLVVLLRIPIHFHSTGRRSVPKIFDSQWPLKMKM